MSWNKTCSDALPDLVESRKLVFLATEGTSIGKHIDTCVFEYGFASKIGGMMMMMMMMMMIRTIIMTISELE